MARRSYSPPRGSLSLLSIKTELIIVWEYQINAKSRTTVPRQQHFWNKAFLLKHNTAEVFSFLCPWLFSHKPPQLCCAFNTSLSPFVSFSRISLLIIFCIPWVACVLSQLKSVATWHRRTCWRLQTLRANHPVRERARSIHSGPVSRGKSIKCKLCVSWTRCCTIDGKGHVMRAHTHTCTHALGLGVKCWKRGHVNGYSGRRGLREECGESV